MEKIKIHENKKGFESWKARREELNGLIEVFANELMGDNLVFNKGVLKQFVKEGTEFIYGLLEEQAQAEIKKLKIVSKTVRENLLLGIGKAAGKYAYSHLRLSKALTGYEIGISDILFLKGKPTISEEELNLKREEFIVYIESEDEQELWDCLGKISDSMNELEQIISRNDLLSIFTLGVPENLYHYINFLEDPKYEPTLTHKNLGTVRPLSGNMICEPDPYAVKLLERKPMPGVKPGIKPGSKPGTPAPKKPEPVQKDPGTPESEPEPTELKKVNE
jgi:hypothetical protein